MRFELQNASFEYRGIGMLPQPVFRDLSVVMESSRVTAVIGDEGSGKTTLLQILIGLQMPSHGSVFVDGTDPLEAKGGWRKIRRNIGYAMQFPEQQFFCETVADELLYAARQFKLQISSERGTCIDVLKSVRLSQEIIDRSPFSLSMGEARRVAIAALLVHQPDTLLLDEPTAGLDDDGYDDIVQILTRLKKRGATIVIATHEHSLVSQLADSVLLLGSECTTMTRQEYLSNSTLVEKFSY